MLRKVGATLCLRCDEQFECMTSAARVRIVGSDMQKSVYAAARRVLFLHVQPKAPKKRLPTAGMTTAFVFSSRSGTARVEASLRRLLEVRELLQSLRASSPHTPHPFRGRGRQDAPDRALPQESNNPPKASLAAWQYVHKSLLKYTGTQVPVATASASFHLVVSIDWSASPNREHVATFQHRLVTLTVRLGAGLCPVDEWRGRPWVRQGRHAFCSQGVYADW